MESSQWLVFRHLERMGAAGLALFCAVWAVAGHAESAPRLSPSPPALGADLFTNGAVHRIDLAVTAEGLASLRRDHRQFVRATVTEGSRPYPNVALRLKGSVGSFREVDGKPALTLDFGRFDVQQRFHGLRRIHLNNSVEDPSYCNEALGSELFEAAGVPAPRVTHALVQLNGRQLGLYVLKEGFTEDFLAGHFRQIGGNLYEPGEGHDVNQRLQRVAVQAPTQDRTALKALAAAALEPDLARRWQRFQRTLAVDRFVTFMALEVMLGHRDGYCLARNNFRVYQDLDTGKMLFFPHGMDQLLGRPEFPWNPHFAGLVARALVETPEGKQRYRESFVALFARLFRVEPLTNRVNQMVGKLRPFVSAAEFSRIQSEAAALQLRIVQRRSNLATQLSQPEPQLLRFIDGVCPLNGWVKTDETTTQKMESATSPDGTPALRIVAAGETAASWRTRGLLPRGRYLFEGRARVAGVAPLLSGTHQGAGLRVAGRVRQAGNLTGTSTWQTLREEFQVDDALGEVEFICELRARAGEVWFDLASLKVVPASGPLQAPAP